MAEKNNGFMKAFLPGLVIGLVVGGIAGAVLPEMLAAKPIHTEPATGGSVPGARERDGRDPGLEQPGDLIVPETPGNTDDETPEEDGDGSGG